MPQTISGQSEVTLYLRVSEMEENVHLQVGDVMSKGIRVVKPSEMLKIELSPEHLNKIREGTSEIIVNCEERRRK